MELDAVIASMSNQNEETIKILHSQLTVCLNDLKRCEEQLACYRNTIGELERMLINERQCNKMLVNELNSYRNGVCND